MLLHIPNVIFVWLVRLPEIEDRESFATLGKAPVSLKGTCELGFRYRSRPSKKLPNIYVCAL
jgi:hypothetical protein